MRGAGLLRKHFTVSMEVPSKDHSYHWVLQYISRHSMRTRSVASQHLGVETTFARNKATGDTVTNFDFVPSPGQHWLSYRGRFIQVVRERNETMVDLQNGLPWETVTLTTVGRSREIFESLLNDAREAALSSQEGRTVVYTRSALSLSLSPLDTTLTMSCHPLRPSAFVFLFSFLPPSLPCARVCFLAPTHPYSPPHPRTHAQSWYGMETFRTTAETKTLVQCDPGSWGRGEDQGGHHVRCIHGFS